MWYSGFLKNVKYWVWLLETLFWPVVTFLVWVRNYRHILKCQKWLQVMDPHLVLLRFWVFSYIFDEYSYLHYCISINLSLIVHLINTDMSKCDYKLWNAPWFYCAFWVFSYIVDDYSCLKFCIFSKLCVSYQFTHVMNACRS